MRQTQVIYGLVGLLVVSLAWPPVSGQWPSDPAINIQITVNTKEIEEGESVVISALAMQPNGQPAPSIVLHATVNGQSWGADYPTLPSGVAHVLLPLPERGVNSVSVTNGKSVSNAVTVLVNSRHFDLTDDPDHLVILEYETWFGPGYAEWGKEEATPLLGRYSSLDPRVVRQHALWMDEMGFNVAELDWTNNLTDPFPSAATKECIAATDLLLQVYSTMPQHPKLIFMVGPEHNLWNSPKDVYDGPWFKQQIDFLYQHYIESPKYRDMFVTYLGKPLMLYYLNGPRTGPPPKLQDDRFTMRYVGAWLQTTHQEEFGVWSWYDQSPVVTLYQGKAEALTITNGYPSVHRSATGLDNWLAQDAGGKNYGETYRTQWNVAMRMQPRFLFVNQWNEFVPPDQYNANLSNDMEPTLMTEREDPRTSGWGFYYFDLTRAEIAEYRTRILSQH